MKLSLSVAIGNYDRTRALVDGRVQIDGVHPAFMTLSPEEMFFRAFRHADFDITELSLASYAVSLANGANKYGPADIPVTRISPFIDLCHACIRHPDTGSDAEAHRHC